MILPNFLKILFVDNYNAYIAAAYNIHAVFLIIVLVAYQSLLEKKGNGLKIILLRIFIFL
jgi:hypothetical protein